MLTFPGGFIDGKRIARHGVSPGGGVTNIFDVEGDVIFHPIVICKETATTSDAITVIFGVNTDTNLFLTSTNGALLTAGLIWHDSTPSESVFQYRQSPHRGYILSNVTNISITTTGTWTAGKLDFDCWWVPLSAGAKLSVS